jgi:periodic tryptophan protein 2
MRLGYKLRRLLGSVHANGNLVFHPDGNSILSAVRNRVAWIDLVNQTSSVLPPQTRSDIAVLACSNDGKLLVAVDVQGRAMLISLARRLALHRIAFKRPVTALAFSPDDGLLAVAVGKVVEVWRTRSLRQHITFNLSLVRSYGGQSQDITCLEWAPDGRHFIAGCRDMTARIYYANLTGEETGFIPSTLAGHRDELVGAFWGSEDTCYTVARDGGVFWWEFELAAGSTKTGLYCPSQGRWKLAQKQFVRPSTHGSSVASASLQRERGLLVLGFSNGVFGLYEMPDASPIHTLSVGQEGLSASAINSTGEWLAFGCAKFGQMLVWEWQSESYVIKQQGHNYGLNCLAFSPNGALLATGGEDNKVKLWNAGSGFSFVTFAEHEAPVTAVAFTSNGSAVLSASLDGTVRAHDLIRYKNFRTLATPSPAQLSCLAVDPAGEIVAAGSIEPFEIYVWSLQTGKVLDVFSGHEAPVSSLDFSPTDGMLASASWDGTVKIWAIYKHELVEVRTNVPSR